jgi:hypothetical protein
MSGIRLATWREAPLAMTLPLRCDEPTVPGEHLATYVVQHALPAMDAPRPSVSGRCGADRVCVHLAART